MAVNVQCWNCDKFITPLSPGGGLDRSKLCPECEVSHSSLEKRRMWARKCEESANMFHRYYVDWSSSLLKALSDFADELASASAALEAKGNRKKRKGLARKRPLRLRRG